MGDSKGIIFSDVRCSPDIDNEASISNIPVTNGINPYNHTVIAQYRNPLESRSSDMKQVSDAPKMASDELALKKESGLLPVTAWK